MTLQEAAAAIIQIIEQTDWDERSKSPAILISIIEAKSELIRAHEKLKKALKATEEL